MYWAKYGNPEPGCQHLNDIFLEIIILMVGGGPDACFQRAAEAQYALIESPFRAEPRQFPTKSAVAVRRLSRGFPRKFANECRLTWDTEICIVKP